ncbi:nuclear transport factor 2 family protein [Pararobbsia silviterrae]|uniref:Nuclear transport factor 2 family protein n=1 Tax=Pararobbsia silviterrae TaxID=1792498 RepID=A0A494XRU9_9BURK|nr:nuclear transport factor 2 family protein [Pararobbsia silviterrae]RKP53367.1 nuclear transport factor 2 family protein [Pararobbsia silviterrae]
MTDRDFAADIRALEERRRIAMLAADTATLRTLFDASLVYLHSTGLRDTRESYLDKLEDGTMRYEALAFDVTELIARERFALLRAKMSATITTPKGTFDVASDYEAVWMHSDGTWRAIAIQGFVAS